MRIEELILDGFKSYPVRTTITGWDSSFNAITGLNGSGKSNILDAICFVLGITNMTSVRANNLMDLIYKRGQAGVKKASVTIVFDNSDRSQSPVGFETTAQITVTRQIAVGNTSKYLLNGHKSTLQALQNLFQSVQLNINNPNFLIMQGKITKVLNMKAPEILGMVEEAAGTRMFEDRKEKAFKAMSKKDKKVEEISLLLKEEIDPKLEKLREEKRSYLAYQKATSELERLTRLVKAYEYHLAVLKAQSAGQEVKDKQLSIEGAKRDATKFRDEQKQMEAEMEETKKRRDKELAKGGKFQALADTVNSLETELVKLRAQLEIGQSNLVDEKKRIVAAEKGVADLEAALGQKEASNAEEIASFAGIKEAFGLSETELAKAETLLQTLLTGLSANSKDEGEATGGYMGQLAEAKARLTAAGTEAEQAKMKIGMLEKEVKEKEPKAKRAAKDGEGLIGQYESVKKKLAELREIVRKTDWDEGKERALLQRRGELQSQIGQLSEQRDRLRSRLSSLEFTYDNPYPNFDRSKVKGLVVNLIELDEANFKQSTAIETCAGGRLYDVVVDHNETGKDLIANGRLKQRRTIVPLNQITAPRLPTDRIEKARSVAPGKVQLALELVGYSDDVAKAIQWVFGDMMVCADKESAQKVAFNKAIALKSITVDGDVYDPSGTLSGGAAPSSGGMLVKAQELKGVERQIAALQSDLDSVLKELSAAKATIETFKRSKRELDLKEHEASLLESQVNDSSGARLLVELESAKTEIVALKAIIATSKEKQREATAECKRLEKEMADFKNNKDSKLKEIKADIANRKKEVTKQSGNVKTRQRAIQTAELEYKQLQSDLQVAQGEVVEAKQASSRLEKELTTLAAGIESAQSKHKKAEEKLKAERAVLTRFDDELADLERDLKAKKQEIADSELALKKIEHEMTLLLKEQLSAAGLIENLEKQFTWILDERKSFGKPNTPFDFEGVNLGQSREKCRELEAQHKGLGRKVNNKVMIMLDRVEKQEQSLKKMISTVLKDKTKIESTIVQLDKHKRDALMKTWTKVNGDFGNIFADMLPGNTCKLEPPEGLDITQGLEVKVRLGSIWKSSLTELSGGQRSLIALSLILSLMSYSPAPLYILDEVDAALDLQHTANIGRMISNRFKGSQFIIVSLKSSLFEHANTLFQAKFRDGTSTVERTINRSAQGSKKGSSGHDKENEQPNNAARGGKRLPSAKATQA